MNNQMQSAGGRLLATARRSETLIFCKAENVTSPSAPASRNNYLDTLEYGNNDSVKYTYDNQGRVTKQTYEDGDTVSYGYDNNGALATVKDSGSGMTTTYYYDFLQRPVKYTEVSSGQTNTVEYTYDVSGNLKSAASIINGGRRTVDYAVLQLPLLRPKRQTQTDLLNTDIPRTNHR